MRHVLGVSALSLPLALLASLAAPLAAAPGGAPQTPPTPPAADAALSERTAALAPIQIDSLTLTPIVSTAPAGAKDEPMLVLDEAMPAGKVKIAEIAEGSVNSLTLTNGADQPLFLMAGEVVLGGKQDRIIGRNTVIPARTTQDVPVFCVEHGRWSGGSREFATAKALAHGTLRGKANFASQGEVWREVATKNAERKTENASDTYRRVAQQQSDGTLTALEQRVNAELAKLPATTRDRMVGFAVALNGAVATVDVFGSPTLFRKLETKLVHSYLTEAVDVAARPGAKPPTAADVRAFMLDADKAAEQRAYDTAAASTKTQQGGRAAKAKVELKTAPNAAPAPSVYETYQAH